MVVANVVLIRHGITRGDVSSDTQSIIHPSRVLVSSPPEYSLFYKNLGHVTVHNSNNLELSVSHQPGVPLLLDWCKIIPINYSLSCFNFPSKDLHQLVKVPTIFTHLSADYDAELLGKSFHENR